MTWDVDDAELHFIIKVEGGKPEINGDAALFFLFQAVGIDSGQGADKTRLAMVNMAGSA
jgi:hypothetical protein